MQSGISVSKELHEAFNNLVSSPSERGLLVSIDKETLVPGQVIHSTSPDDFDSDLSNLAPLLKEKEAAYVLLRRYGDVGDAFIAVTYVPDAANVRQKMLFASTRLNLVRELGTERFRETLFATTREELTAEGFRKHDQHGELKPPLTQEEEALEGVKAAEAEESRGTSVRSIHVSSGVAFPITEEALTALKELESGTDNLVQLRIEVSTETIHLAGTSASTADTLATTISDNEPRYSFFRYEHDFEGTQESPVVFIYTCPTGAKIKERMLYAASRAAIVVMATKEVGLIITKRLEASNPDEITPGMIHEEFHPKREEKAAFSRPKRPGR
ncbi:MAG: dihydrofolate reductase [Chaenotheca gracillima]|nr:MAG: dihydrofolate reductase [Chaenotheca gracillima]